jgi:hypothetical protein
MDGKEDHAIVVSQFTEPAFPIGWRLSFIDGVIRTEGLGVVAQGFQA